MMGVTRPSRVERAREACAGDEGRGGLGVCNGGNGDGETDENVVRQARVRRVRDARAAELCGMTEPSTSSRRPKFKARAKARTRKFISRPGLPVRARRGRRRTCRRASRGWSGVRGATDASVTRARPEAGLACHSRRWRGRPGDVSAAWSLAADTLDAWTADVGHGHVVCVAGLEDALPRRIRVRRRGCGSMSASAKEKWRPSARLGRAALGLIESVIQAARLLGERCVQSDHLDRRG